MGALANLRKRASEFLSFSFDSPDKINQTDTTPSKKRRISNVNQFSVEENSVARLRKYPETVGRLGREVHGPCRSSRVGFLSRNGGIRVSGMGNVIGVVTKLRRDYETKKRAAFDAFCHVRVENKGLPEVVVIDDGDRDLELKKRAAFDTLRHVRVEKKGFPEVVVIEDGDGDGDGDYESKKRAAFDALRHVRVEKKGLSEVVVIEDGDGDGDGKEGVERDGLGLGVESRDLDRKGVESDGDVVESEMLGREAYQELLSSVDRKYSSRLRSLDFEIKSNEAKLESVRSWWSARKQPDEKKPEEDVLRAAFVPLSEEEEDEVKSALLNANRYFLEPRESGV